MGVSGADAGDGSVTPAAQAEQYAFLSQRAAAFVRSEGGAVPEDRLVSHVFGSAGSAGLWGPLLRRVLGGGDGLVLRADGWWTLADNEPAAGDSLLAEFVAVDVETTGLRPLHQRIIELALVRYRDGVEVERLETLCDPEKRIPKYVAELTGIRDADVVAAPRFAAIADAVVRFAGEATLVGHNVGFDLAFLNAELKRLGRPGLVNERVDTLGLANRLLPQVRKPNLEQIARALGIVPGRLHRAGVDAQLAAEVAVRLVARAREQGLISIEAIKAASSVPRRPRDGVGRGRAVLDRSLLDGIPRAPGVYLMRDAHDQIVYVGKARNLRERVASYYSQPLGYTRKMDGLLESLVRIDVEVVGSELEALLLEAQLIRRYQPRYNTALRAAEHYPYIRVDVANPWPRITLVKDRKADGARYFGPFRSKTAARKTVELIHRVLPLRTCPRSFKDARSYGSPCLQLDLGRCLGPCVGRADHDAYRALVHDALRFLDGRDQTLHERLWRGLEEAAERLDFEAADRLRRDLRQVTAVVDAHRLLCDAVEAHTLLLVLPSAERGAREVLLVVGGRLWAQIRANRDAPDDLAGRLARVWQRLAGHEVPPLDQDAVDEANILNRWLYRHAGHPAILPLPRPPAEPDWHGLAEQAVALSDAKLTFDPAALDAGDVRLDLMGADD